MEHSPLVYALVHALDRAITGTMVFHPPTGESHTVTFFEGAPVRVEPGVEGDRIGEDLVAMDHLSEAMLADALVTAQSSRKRLGEILVQGGVLDATALTEALTLQTARRLAALANLPPESTFSLYFSARAEPEPHAPWAPLDTLLATIRAWQDRSRLRGTLRWLADKRLRLSPAEANLDAVMLTSRERDAVSLMRRESPSLKTLYGKVGKGLSSLLYMLAVTRQFSFTSSKGAPLGRRKESDLIRDAVQIAVPIAPVIMTAADAPDADVVKESDSIPPPPDSPPAARPETLDASPPVPAPASATAPAPATPVEATPAPSPVPPPPQAPPATPSKPPPAIPRPSATPGAPARKKVSLPKEMDDDAHAAPARVAPPAPAIPRPGRVPEVASPAAAHSAVPQPSETHAGTRASTSTPPPAHASSPGAPAPEAPPVKREPPRPSFSPPKFVDQGRPPARIAEQGVRAEGSQMSSDFRLAEDAAKRSDFDTADRILRERCTEDDSSEADFQALSAWVKANLDKSTLKAAIDDLTFLLMAHNACESGLYYRGMLLIRLGKDKAALRDFVTVVKQNPNHVGALNGIKQLREAAKNG